MKTLFILVPIVLLGIVFAGGLGKQSPFGPHPPSNTSATLLDATPNPEQKSLQIRNLTAVTNTPAPSSSPTNPVTPTITPSQTCGGDTIRTVNCACQPPPIESIGVICDNAIETPSVVVQDGQPISSTQTCPDNGIPCSIYLASSNRQNYYQWRCGPKSCLYIKDNVDDVLDSGNSNYQKYATQCSDHNICFAKPVIYLYPTEDMLVDVTLSIPGTITKSIPEYRNGWFNVFAHPDGKLEYQGKIYNELFYESEVAKANPPRNGIIIPKDQLPSKLATILLNLGLNETETQEFLAYWLPRLTQLKSNYVLFSIFEPNEKERVDKVKIFPEPDTRIEFLAYFKPLARPINVKPLILPEKPPERKGFTEVEWGGTIDTR